MAAVVTDAADGAHRPRLRLEVVSAVLEASVEALEALVDSAVDIVVLEVPEVLADAAGGRIEGTAITGYVRKITGRARGGAAL